MKALLLSAGFGMRLRPITDKIPKALVPINGKPLLEYWLENLYNAGINEFLINTHYLSEKIEIFTSNSKFKDNITLVYEDELLLTGGTVLKNRDFFQDEPFFVIHADNLCFCDFNEFIKAHEDRPKETIATMMLFYSDNPSNCGVVKLKDNIMVDFFEKLKNPPSNLANGAVYIFEKEIFDILKEFKKEKIDLSLEVIPKLKNRIYTYINDLYLRDIGSIESYALAQIEVLEYL